MQKELKDMSDVEIKAVIYDNLVLIEKSQFNIKRLTQELLNRENNTTTVS